MHFDDEKGNPLVGGKLYTYRAGTNTPAVTYSDNAGTANTNPFISIASSGEKDIGESLEFVDGNIEGQTTSIVPGKGVWHFDLELAFQGPSTNGYVKYDLKVYSGNTPLRAISFGFQNLSGLGKLLSQWIGGIIECDENEAISFTIERVEGSLGANLGIPNFFIHKV